MKKLFILILFCYLCSCNNTKVLDVNKKTIVCYKDSIVSDEERLDMPFNYLVSFVTTNGILNRKILINEYMRNSFVDNVSYQKYMDLLLEAYLMEKDNPKYKSSILPYYETDRIVYPHTILDYTDLSYFSSKEVPKEVRTKDGKAIDFALYWEYMKNMGMLDDFTCTLRKDV